MYNPSYGLPSNINGGSNGAVMAQFSTNDPPVFAAIPAGSSYQPVNVPASQVDSQPVISSRAKPPLPPQPGLTAPSGDTPPGGTTHVLPPDGPLSPDGLPVGGINYQPRGYVAPVMADGPFSFDESWTWQVLPGSILYKSYLASNREPRFGSQMVHVNDLGNFWDVTLGGRAGILRYGNNDPFEPQGYQLDFEGAAFPRLNFDHDRDLEDVDFRFGIPLTMRVGRWQTKFGYYHLSSHLGDEYMVRNSTFDRINYVRESLMLGVGFFLNPNFRLYSEVDYAFYVDGGAKPWEFQFGAEYSPIDCDRLRGSPFLAVHGHLHQEVDFSGSVTAQIGWQWRGRTGHLLRTGFQYFNGMSDQAQFFSRFEQQYGWGVWYDF
jgi:hypothetical protein